MTAITAITQRASRPPRVDRGEAIRAVRALLTATGADGDSADLRRTPERVADALLDAFAGIGSDPAIALGTPLPVPDEEWPSIVALRDIPFRSTCEHHLLPFAGTVDVVYAPERRIAGLGRIVACIELAARRPQLQERLGAQIAEALASVLAPRGAVVRITATHGCVGAQHPAAAAATCVTLTRRGRMCPDLEAALYPPHRFEGEQ